MRSTRVTVVVVRAVLPEQARALEIVMEVEDALATMLRVLPQRVDASLAVVQVPD